MKPDGGPAFPQTMVIGQNGQLTSGWDGWGMGGATLRDYFAAAALNGMLAHATRYRPRPDQPQQWHLAIAEEAYQLADAMLAERSKA